MRWINFVDFITVTGVQVNFEHIDGKLNVFADALSRLTANMVYTRSSETTDAFLASLEEVVTEVTQAPNEEVVENLCQLVEKIYFLLNKN